MTLGERIFEARKSRGLTQDTLAHPGLTKSAISQIERGRTTPTIRTLDLLAQRLQQPFSYFLTGVEPWLSSLALRKLITRGQDELKHRNFEAALAAFADARDLAISHAPGFAKQLSEAFLGLGETFLLLRRFDDARQQFKEARACGAPNRWTEARALHGLAKVEHRCGRFAEAIELYRAALDVMPKSAPPGFRGEVWVYLGTVLFRAGRLQESWDASARARTIFERAGLTDRLGGALMNLGFVRYQEGRYDDAVLLYEQALLHLEQAEDVARSARVRNNLGIALLALGRPRDALQHLSVSLTIARRLGDAILECWVLTELARCHAAASEPRRAHEYAEQAIAKSRKVSVPDEVVRAHLVLGGLALGAGDAEKATRYFATVIEAAHSASMMQELVAGRLGLARAAVIRGRHKDATAHYDQLLAVLQGVRPDDGQAALRMACLILPAIKVHAV